ncbi:putative alpha/beta hydrolase family esterase [Pararhizobium capsulatum DSM 1112]|uniref:Alpha/beta hydrolase family esterase n=1 Tax=Pararhizobium capsulatum DSM 1112 TaxID=1121113 RepID=A0ABU0BMR0_9HYPH|nr:alpha/beta hydrolase [Pararhizobium capsulatum]MDQ0319541.1 putative alpha/beta hydrolase family esterase [Pararhizobium capsulatum DSM 1112]
MSDIIILPGIGGSGESHWQTRWEKENPAMTRFAPSDWENPDLADWITALEKAVRKATHPPVLVAHSLACLLVTYWQAGSETPVAGAFLVAVPDPSSEAFPKAAASFSDPPIGRLRMPSLVVASSDDPYGTPEYSRMRAREWGSGLIEIGPAGHINGQSGLKGWREGLNLLTAFRAGIEEDRGNHRYKR